MRWRTDIRRPRTLVRRPLPWAAALLLVGVGGAGLAGAGVSRGFAAEDPQPRETTASEDPLARLGLAVTSGAAPGYVEDRACAICHGDLVRSYQEVAMSRAFYRPRPDRDIEDFGHSEYFHGPSQNHYQMLRRGDDLVFRRWQLDAEGRPLHEVEQKVDWVLGSGNHSRVYLYRNPAGELYQLPLAWYTQEQAWGMAPGFDRANHLGLSRRVLRPCMFCHNAYPDVPAGSDLYGEPPVYPADLPEGLGCQRCHGPAAEHVRRAFAGAPRDQLRSSVVNPGRLEPRLRDGVCFGCHFQPSVALPGVRRFGRGDYSFRPGEPLSDYVVAIDVDEAGRSRSERFEINHHPYRLRQSRCYLASGGALSCLTCHDPHRKVPEAERAAHYRAACLGCHQIEDCRLEEMTGETRLPDVAPDDCVGCHMAKRRTEDVVHVVMTDHLIRRRPGGPELLAPLEERDPVLTGVDFVWPDRAPQGALGEVYRALAVLRVAATENAVEHLERSLAAARPPEIDPYLDLARSQLVLGHTPEAEATLRNLLERSPDHPQVLAWLGIVELRLGRPTAAVADLRRALELEPRTPEIWFNLGRALMVEGRTGEAAEALEKSVELRPHLAAGWFHLGQIRAAEKQLPEALEAYRRSLAADPTSARATVGLGRLLAEMGQRGEALRVLRHGVEVVRSPETVEAALAAVEQEAGQGAEQTPEHESDAEAPGGIE